MSDHDPQHDHNHGDGITEPMERWTAEFWDERMGEGNQFQRMLVGPATERLLELRDGERVLEIEKSPDGRGAPTGLTAPTVRGRVRRTRAPRRTHAKRRPGAAVLATAEKSKK